MTNRFSKVPALDPKTPVYEMSFTSCSKEYLELNDDFERTLLALEKRHPDKMLSPRVRESAFVFGLDSFRNNTHQPCCFDTAGLREDFEIDVRWI